MQVVSDQGIYSYISQPIEVCETVKYEIFFGFQCIYFSDGMGP